MTLQNAFGDIALDNSVQAVKTSVDAVLTKLNGTINVNAGTGFQTNALTNSELRATAVPVSGTFWQTTQPISGTITANAGSGTFAISAASLPLPTGAATQTTLAAIDTKLGSTLSVNVGLTDTQLRASPVAISGTVTANTGLAQPLTDTQLRASALPISGTVAVTGVATETTLSSLNSKITAVNTGAVTISTSLPTGTNSIGQVTANAGTNLNTSALNLETTQSAINTKIPSGLTVSSTRLLIDGSGVTQPVSVASLPLPTGASTNAKLDEVITAIEGISGGGGGGGGGGGLTDAQLRASPLEIESVVLDEIRNLADSINTLVQFLYANSPRIDVANRMAVNNSEVTQPISGSVTATIGSGTITNITQLSAQPVQYLGQDVPLHIYNHIEVT